ncbi:MAG: family 16 glycoside hydrolase [Balneolaceae bacterium]
MNKLLCLALAFFLYTACQSSEPGPDASEELQELPFNRILLQSLEPFQAPGRNWQIAGAVQSDYLTDHSIQAEEGSGILANLPTGNEDTNLVTNLEHGDIELKIEFLVPRGSNSGIYLQSRYELQILDSWGSENPLYSDIGGIYERWDESQPEGERGYEGHAPLVNAGLAPGLWQEFHVLFRAPRFDRDGNKVQNARFEFVRLNGQLIQEEIELTGPTRGAVSQTEVPHAPILIQGDHGPVAFRNFRYKTYELTDSLRLGELSYTVYDFNGVRLPDFGQLTDVLAEGVTESFDVTGISPKNEYYAARFSGELEVPVSGEYLFQTQISNGGNLYINGDLVIPNDGEIDYHLLGNIIHLEAGTHQLEMSYFQRTWSRDLWLYYEGPNMERRPLGSDGPSASYSVNNPLVVIPEPDHPELLGGFTNYGDEKRTHTLSVGSAERMHYSYDLFNATLLKFWRGPFADVTQMWRGRGEEQLLVPLNASIEDKSLFVLARSEGNSVTYIDNLPARLSGQEYLIRDNGFPMFRNRIDGIQIDDEITPDETNRSLVRVLRYQADEARPGYVAVLAAGSELDQISNRIFRVNGNFYVRLPDSLVPDIEIRESGELLLLTLPILQNSNLAEVRYELIW